MRPTRARALLAMLVGVVALVTITIVAPAGAARSAPGTLQTPDPYFPNLGNTGYDVKHYDVGVTYAPPARELHGDTRISAVATRRLTGFNLDLAGLTVRRVDVDGRRARFRQKESELIIQPAKPVATGKRFALRVRYDGRPRPGEIPGLGAPDGWIETPDGAVTLDEPDGASRWFPSNDHPSDKATFTFRLTLPDPLVGIANGTLRSHESKGGQTTWVWDESAPMATYLTQLALGSYTIVDGGSVDGVTLRNAYAPSTRAIGEQGATETAAMIRFFADQLGRFPFTSYGILVPDAGVEGLAFEAQTFSTFAPDAVDSVVLAHELSHQWFGDWVSPASWRETWLNEGFATYFEWLWREHAFGVPLAQSAANAEREVARDEQTAADDPGRDRMFSPAPYQRGALTLYALRKDVGDSQFGRILRTYLGRFGGRSATTRDFIGVASEVAGRNLGPSFRAWLGPGPFPSRSGVV